MRRLLLLVILAACRPPGWGQADAGADAALDARPPADARVDAAIDAPPVTCDATFRLEGYSGATSVWLTGDFVGWAGTPAAGAVALVLGGDGAWTVVHTFAAGTYQYKLIIDGTTWIADPANPNTIDDGYGGVNSVYVCAG